MSQYKVVSNDAEINARLNPSLTEGVVQGNQMAVATVKALLEKDLGAKVVLRVDEANKQFIAQRVLNG